MTDHVHSASEQASAFLIVQAMNKVGRVVSVGVTVPVKCTERTCIIRSQLQLLLIQRPILIGPKWGTVVMQT